MREAIEHDLLVRGIDLGDLYADRMSIRRFRVLVRGLPEESRMKTVLRRIYREQGAAKTTPIEELPAEVWSTQEWMTATLIDEVRVTRWLYAAKNRKPGTPAPPFPDLMPRPGGQPRKRKRINAFFSAFGLPPLEAAKS